MRDARAVVARLGAAGPQSARGVRGGYGRSVGRAEAACGAGDHAALVFRYGSPLVCNARAALIHQPTFPAAFAERVRLLHLPLEQGLQRPSMWISYAPVDEIVVRKHVVFGQHHVLIGPQPGWEGLKVGG